MVKINVVGWLKEDLFSFKEERTHWFPRTPRPGWSFPPNPASVSATWCILCISVGIHVVMLFKLSHVAKLNMCSLKIAHNGAVESSRACRQRHRFWKWVLIKYQTSSCPLEGNAPMPGPLLFQESHCSLALVNKEHANILITFAWTLEPALWIPGKSKSNLLSWEVLSWACVKINSNASNHYSRQYLDDAITHVSYHHLALYKETKTTDMRIMNHSGTKELR